MTNPKDPQEPDYGAYRYPASSPEPAAGQTPSYGSYDSRDATPHAYTGTTGYAGVDSTWAMAKDRNRVAPWALGLGILALIMGVSIFLSGFAFIPGAIGIIVAVVAIVRGRRLGAAGRRTAMSVTGLILAAVGVILSIVFWVVVSVLVSESGIGECMNITDPDAQRICVEDAINEMTN